MDIKLFFEQSGLPLIAGVICLYYGIRLILTRDCSLVRGKDKPPVKDEAAYSKQGGLLITCLGIAMLIMAVVLLFSAIAAVIEMVVLFILFAFLWKRLNDKYGAI